jgi:hypothetical protein
MQEESKCPKWEKFINEVLPEKEKQDQIKRACELWGFNIFTGLILRGSGVNGKSVLAGVLKKATNGSLFIEETNKVGGEFGSAYFVIDFEVSIPESNQNPYLLSELMGELPAIKEWLLS